MGSNAEARKCVAQSSDDDDDEVEHFPALGSDALVASFEMNDVATGGNCEEGNQEFGKAAGMSTETKKRKSKTSKSGDKVEEGVEIKNDEGGELIDERLEKKKEKKLKKEKREPDAECNGVIEEGLDSKSDERIDAAVEKE